MAAKDTDPTDPIRKAAGAMHGATESTSCTQASFKLGKKAFLYTGPQGDRFKAMFKLDASMADAQKLAKTEPDRFETGSTGWVTARFSADKPMPKRLWDKWLKESYALAAGTAPSKKKAGKKKAAKKAARR
ncbi:MAG: MmcQ/YjbR family DNA-binding protein [Phycisphaera sp.]|nr:MAG: MmcQ/YjbR family DNA-binding protein [Phycisphaera sp.]